MPSDTAHLAERVDRPAAEVYAYASNPAHLPEWAPGLGKGVEQTGGDWFVLTDAGRVKVVFAPPNDFGILDHWATFPDGQTFLNPLRVVPYGDDSSEIVFSVRRAPGTSDEDFARDTGLVRADLARLKSIVESR
ncbi:SRPBCC family protein [Actinoplanes sp. NPDC000266]